MDKSTVSTSKFLSLVLRHQPEAIGITLDENGWVDVDDLLDKARKSGKKISRSLLEQTVRDNDKQRFALSEDATRIRANQGHSVSVDLQLEEQTPPDELFHGTVPRFLDSIRAEGLVPGARQHVHLSKDRETATKVGTRRGKPVILVIDARQMHADGHKFYLSANKVWLADAVPAKYIRS